MYLSPSSSICIALICRPNDGIFVSLTDTWSLPTGLTDEVHLSQALLSIYILYNQLYILIIDIYFHACKSVGQAPGVKAGCSNCDIFHTMLDPPQLKPVINQFGLQTQDFAKSQNRHLRNPRVDDLLVI